MIIITIKTSFTFVISFTGKLRKTTIKHQKITLHVTKNVCIYIYECTCTMKTVSNVQNGIVCPIYKSNSPTQPHNANMWWTLDTKQHRGQSLTTTTIASPSCLLKLNLSPLAWTRSSSLPLPRCGSSLRILDK